MVKDKLEISVKDPKWHIRGFEDGLEWYWRRVATVRIVNGEPQIFMTGRWVDDPDAGDLGL